MAKKHTLQTFLITAHHKFDNQFEYSVTEPFDLSAVQIITCPTHGEFTMTGRDHIHSKYGCPQCGAAARSLATTTRNAAGLISWTDRLAQIRAVHGDQYTYPDNFSGGILDKVTVTCPHHGLFAKHLFALIDGSGCQKCRHEATKTYARSTRDVEAAKISAHANRVISNNSRSIPFATAVERFRSRHGNKFQYIEAKYTGISHTIAFICEKHGEVTMNGREHEVSLHGCPHCAVNNKSKAEEVWLTHHKVPVIQHSIQLTNGKRAVVDGYDPITNTVYEFLGDFWHGHPSWHNKFNGVNDRNSISFKQLHDSTEKRLQQLSDMGYNIIYAWETDVNIDICKTRTFTGILEC